ncbi:MAG: putative transport protein [uncultured marine phage]|uniref:Putative transport protein n=1 Tax=uncultured marine phage TaxID=707152 RepID=A0A8D9FR53_9VIRU|nr:MAG: putative transport protein [uncultured marine phage]
MKDYAEFINRLFESREQTHVFHLQTDSNAEHLALQEYYEGILEHIDSLVEMYQGQYDIVGDYQSIQPRDYDKSDVVKYLQELAQWVQENKSDYIKESDTHLLTIVDEAVALMYTTLYKLRFLK